jgi:hypothetical protein
MQIEISYKELKKIQDKGITVNTLYGQQYLIIQGVLIAIRAENDEEKANP